MKTSHFKIGFYLMLALPAVFLLALCPSCAKAQTAYTLSTGSKIRPEFYTSTNANVMIEGISTYATSSLTATLSPATLTRSGIPSLGGNNTFTGSNTASGSLTMPDGAALTATSSAVRVTTDGALLSPSSDTLHRKNPVIPNSALFKPTDYTNCIFWFAAESLYATATDGAAITTITPSVGTVGTATNVTFIRNGMNGLPSIWLKGNSRATFSGVFDSSNNAGFTIFVAHERTTMNYFETIVSAQNTNSTPIAIWSICAVQNNSANVQVGTLYFKESFWPKPTLNVLGFRYNGTTSLASSFLSNGFKSVEDTFSTAFSFTNADMSFGGGGGYGYRGYISEVIAYNRALSDSECRAVARYLTDKYGSTKKSSRLVVEGDSIAYATLGYGIPDILGEYLDNPDDWVSTIVAWGGKTPAASLAISDAEVISSYDARYKDNVYLYVTQLNGMGSTSGQGQSYYDAHVTRMQKMRAAGYKVLLVSPCSRNDNGAAFETQRQVLVTGFRQHWREYADAFVDTEIEVPELGAYSTNTTSAYFADGWLHPNTAGYRLWMPKIADRLEQIKKEKVGANTLPITSKNAFYFSASRKAMGKGTLNDPWGCSGKDLGMIVNQKLNGGGGDGEPPLPNYSTLTLLPGTYTLTSTLRPVGSKSGLTICGLDKNSTIISVKGGITGLQVGGNNYQADQFTLRNLTFTCPDTTASVFFKNEYAGSAFIENCDILDINNGDGAVVVNGSSAYPASITLTGCRFTMQDNYFYAALTSSDDGSSSASIIARNCAFYSSATHYYNQINWLRYGKSNFTMENCYVYGYPAAGGFKGITVFGCGDVILRNNRLYNAGIEASAATNTLSNVIIQGNVFSNFYITTYNAQNVMIKDNVSLLNGGKELDLKTNSSVLVEGNRWSAASKTFIVQSNTNSSILNNILTGYTATIDSTAFTKGNIDQVGATVSGFAEPTVLYGTGDPEGVRTTGNTGGTFFRLDGTSTNSLYIRPGGLGSGNTGWVAK